MNNNIPKKVKYFFMILALSFVTNLYPTTTDTYLLIVFFVTGFYFHLKRLKYNNGIFYIIIFFLLINFFSSMFYGMFQIPTLVGMILRLLIPYYVIKILKQDFIIYFEKTVYFFAILSIPFYLLQLIKPGIYLQLNPFFVSMTTDMRYHAKIFSYVLHTVHYNALIRNSGFTWEPGGFGYILGIAIMFNLVRNNFTFTRPAIILLLVGLTTLSTTFYIFVFVLLAFYLYERKKKFTILYFALPIIIFVFIYIIQLPFMSEKIVYNVADLKRTPGKYLESTKIQDAGRFGGLYYEYLRFVEYPFGYGINMGLKGKNIIGEPFTGGSGLGAFIRMWGIIGFLYLVYTLYNLSERLSIIYRNKNKIFIMITILLFLFSNPIAREPIFLMMAYFPLFILKKTDLLLQPVCNSTIKY